MAGYRFNPHGNGLIVSDEVHARIHIGQYFTDSYLDVDYTSGEVADVVVEVGAVSHVRFRLDASVNTSLLFYSNPAYSGGTPSVPVNHNRISNIVSANSLVSLPTVSSPGDFIEDWVALGGAGGGRGAGLTDVGEEFILPVGNYLFRATNLTVNTGILHLHMSWYEPGA